jgi:hypothetical protein
MDRNLAVGVGSVWGQVFVGDVRCHIGRARDRRPSPSRSAGGRPGAGKLRCLGRSANVGREQFTKTTSDAILLTHHTVAALNGRSPELIDRGSQALKGKSAVVQLFAVKPGIDVTERV